MNTIKAEAREIIDQMPDPCTWEQIRYQMQVRERLHKALADVQAGNGVPHAQAKEEIEAWLKSSGLAKR